MMGNVFDLTENDMIYNKQHKSKNNNKKIANILHQKKVQKTDQKKQMKEVNMDIGKEIQ